MIASDQPMCLKGRFSEIRSHISPKIQPIRSYVLVCMNNIHLSGQEVDATFSFASCYNFLSAFWQPLLCCTLSQYTDALSITKVP